MLPAFVEQHRADIIERCRAKVASRVMPAPTMLEIEHGVPMFLGQLITALRGGGTAAISLSATLHGHNLHLSGFTVSQVVHDYGDVCQSVTELAGELGQEIPVDEFRILNRCLDDAIAGAVTEFGRAQSIEVRHIVAVEQANNRDLFNLELRNLLQTATLAFGILRSGKVGITGTTADALERSLRGMVYLIRRLDGGLG